MRIHAADAPPFAKQQMPHACRRQKSWERGELPALSVSCLLDSPSESRATASARQWDQKSTVRRCSDMFPIFFLRKTSKLIQPLPVCSSVLNPKLVGTCQIVSGLWAWEAVPTSLSSELPHPPFCSAVLGLRPGKSWCPWPCLASSTRSRGRAGRPPPAHARALSVVKCCESYAR